MARKSRISTIYRKELVDVLRDRRTLVAMLVVPILLYPLLILGMAEAAQYEHAKQRAQQLIVGVTSHEDYHVVENILSIARPETEAHREPPVLRLVLTDIPDADVGESVHLKVVIDRMPDKSVSADQPADAAPGIIVHLIHNETKFASRTALIEFRGALERFGKHLRAQAQARVTADMTTLEASPQVRAAGPPVLDALRRIRGDIEILQEPVKVQTASSATAEERGGWVLSQIVPFILAIMTITGAIYPAIDLTAGERERGTLEALIVAPVPVIRLIVGKFLVVATIAMITATLNLVSIGATFFLGGVSDVMAARLPAQIPLSAIPIILGAMVPFAVLFSALLLAVSSFARTFKEAQNYVVPVMLVAMIPAVVGALPAVRLEGVMLVIPVTNTVLLTRAIFQQEWSWPALAIVVGSTSFYAAVAVAIAARLFGQEAVVFSDTRSYRTFFLRRLMRPRETPTAAEALLLAAILFPLVFHFQTALSRTAEEDMTRHLVWTGLMQIGLILGLPVAVCAYLKISLGATFSWRLPSLRFWFAAVLIGLCAWPLTHEVFVWQSRILPLPEVLRTQNELVDRTLRSMSLPAVVLLLALLPAFCEEMMFRGLLLSGLRGATRKWIAIVAVGVIFGVFHFFAFKLVITALLGILLAYLCWQSRSIFPAMLAHMLYNAAVVILIKYPVAAEQLHIGLVPEDEHVPAHLWGPAIALLVLGILLCARQDERRPAAAFARTEHP